MRSHFKPRESRWAPTKTSRHVIGRLGYNDNYCPKLVERAAEKAFRRRMRWRASGRLAAIAFSHLGDATAGWVTLTMSRPGFLRRIMEPEQCRLEKEQELRDWIKKQRTAPRQLRYHPRPGYKSAVGGKIGYIVGVNVVTDTARPEFDLTKVGEQYGWGLWEATPKREVQDEDHNEAT